LSSVIIEIRYYSSNFPFFYKLASAGQDGQRFILGGENNIATNVPAMAMFCISIQLFPCKIWVKRAKAVSVTAMAVLNL
jgi:hypothetical protein